MTIHIPNAALKAANLNPDSLKIEIAVYLYERKVLSSGQARHIAGLDQISFQLELAKRNVYIHFEMEDLEIDLKNLNVVNP